MHIDKLTSPLADLENMNFLNFSGRLEKGERRIEGAEDIVRDIRPSGRDIDSEQD